MTEMIPGFQKIVAVGVFSCLVSCSADRPAVEQSDEPATTVSSAALADSTPVVLFLGTSLTAGLGVSADEAYPALIQQKLDSAGIGLRVVNAGESGGTSAGGLRRIDVLLPAHDVRVLVLELGANDGLRGLDIAAMRENLSQIIERTRAVHPDARVVLAGMEAPPNLGDRYTEAFRATFAELADRYSATLIPFLLEGVGGVPVMNQEDGIHPNVEGHRFIAETVWAALVPLLRDD